MPRRPVGDAERRRDEHEKHDDRGDVERLTLDLAGNGVGRSGEVRLSRPSTTAPAASAEPMIRGIIATIDDLLVERVELGVRAADIDAGQHERRDDDQDADGIPIVVTAPARDRGAEHRRRKRDDQNEAVVDGEHHESERPGESGAPLDELAKARVVADPGQPLRIHPVVLPIDAGCTASSRKRRSGSGLAAFCGRPSRPSNLW